MEVQYPSHVDQCIPVHFQPLSKFASSISNISCHPLDHCIFRCNNCSTELFDNITPSEYVIINHDTEILSDKILVNSVYCRNCHTFVGFKIVNFKKSKPDPIPLEQNQDIFSLNEYKNNLIQIENNLNSKIAQLNFTTFLQNNQDYIGKIYIYLSNITVKT